MFLSRWVVLGLLLLCGVAAAPAARDEKLTADNYGKIKAGMTSAEVKEILGPPRMTATSGANHDMTMEWRSKAEPSHKIEVRFSNGVVTSKFANIDWAGQAAKAAVDQFKPNFEKLALGMSEQDVQAIMGTTTQTERASAGRSGMTWVLDSKWAYAVFQDGKAVELDCSETPPRNKEITPANYRRISKGMDLAGVEAILGPATETDAQQADRYAWRQGKETLTVILHNGRVAAKTSTIKDVPLVHFEKTVDDKFDAALANLSSTDVMKHVRATEFFENAPYDAARASEVSALLMKSLNSKDARINMTAERAMRKWATKESAGYFLKIIERPQLERSGLEKNFGQIALALDVLSRLKEPEAVPAMVRLLKKFFNRDDAVNALRRMGPELAEKELRKAANDPDYEVRKRVEELLSEFRDGGPQLVAWLKDLKLPKWELRLGAVQQIGKMYVNPRRRAEVARALEGMLVDENGNVVQAAANGLGRWGAAENEPALIKALGHASADVRRESAGALREIGTPKAVASLEALEQDKDHRVVVAAREAIVAIKTRNH